MIDCLGGCQVQDTEHATEITDDIMMGGYTQSLRQEPFV